MGVRGALLAFAVLLGVMAAMIGLGSDAPGGIGDWGVVVSLGMLGAGLSVAWVAATDRRARR